MQWTSGCVLTFITKDRYMLSVQGELYVLPKIFYWHWLTDIEKWFLFKCAFITRFTRLSFFLVWTNTIPKSRSVKCTNMRIFLWSIKYCYVYFFLLFLWKKKCVRERKKRKKVYMSISFIYKLVYMNWITPFILYRSL